MTSAPRAPSPTNWPAAVEGWVLVGLGVMLLRKIYEGQLPIYTHPRYLPLIAGTAVIVVLIGLARLWQTGTDAQPLRGRVGLYGLLLTPLLLGVVVPAKPAGSALLDPKQLNATNGKPFRSANVLAATDSGHWTLLDWMFARYTLKPDEVQGRTADVIGFVYHPPQAPADEFDVVRYTLVCCVADRSGASLPVHWSGSGALPTDQWVRVQGTMSSRPGEGPVEYVITASDVTPVAQPREPYLYP